MNIAETLNKLKWDKRYDFERVKIYYVSRGIEGNIAVITGKEIKKLGKMFIETLSSYIPYHRVLKIEYEGKILFKR